MSKPSLLDRARTVAKVGREALADVGEQAGSLTLTLGPFSAVLWPRRQPLSAPHPGAQPPPPVAPPPRFNLATDSLPHPPAVPRFPR